MRVDLQKILFVGPESKKDEFLSAFQKAASVQFLGTKVTAVDLLMSEFQEVVQAIKVLKQFEVEQTLDVTVTDPLTFARSVIADAQRLTDGRAKLKTAREALHRIAPFGSIPLHDISALESETSLTFRLWMATKKRDASAFCPRLILIAEDLTHQYFVSLTKDEIVMPGLETLELSQETASLPQTITSLEQELMQVEEDLKQRARLTESLKIALVSNLNTTKRQRAGSEATPALEGRLFAMTGWAPLTHLNEVQALAHAIGIFTELLPTPSDEIPPTYLENHRCAKMGEDLVGIYDTPSHTDADPSGWVLGFFSLFFAMIIGDAGYGLVFLGTALWLRSKTRTSSGSMKRFVSLVTVLGFACVAWGLLTNSFFSIKLSVDNPVRSHSLLTYLVERQAQYHLDLQDETYVQWVHRHGDVAPSSVHQFLYEAPSSTISPLYDSMADGTMLELALLIGSIHIIISMCRYVNRNMVNAGWIVSILGGYPFCAHYLHASSILYYLVGLNPETSAAIGLEFLICGLLFAFILSIIKNGIADLFFAVMNAISVFADILSYLRLYALGLSGSIVSGMINSLADAFPFAIAVLLIVLAHVVNVVMSIVGGVIHGLRLNFLEWYHYSFDGGGKPFSPLCLETYK